MINAKWLFCAVALACLVASNPVAAQPPISYCATVNEADNEVLKFAAAQSSSSQTVEQYVQNVVDVAIRSTRPAREASETASIVRQLRELPPADRTAVVQRLRAEDRAAAQAILDRAPQ